MYLLADKRHGVRRACAQRGESAFSIIEVLVALGVMLVLLGISLPALMGVKERAREMQSLSRIRQLGLLVLAYAGDNADRVPAIFPPRFIAPGDPPDCWFTVEVGGRSFTGSWFDNSSNGFYALSPPPPMHVMRAPSHLDVGPIMVDGVGTSHFTDYEIAECYYAKPSYWHLSTQRGPSQWGAQAIGETKFPSHKGLIFQTSVYDSTIPYKDGRAPVSFYPYIPSSVLWADMSATQEVYADMLPGVVNRYRCQKPRSMRPVLPGEKGPAIDNTKHGIFGRDR